MTKEDKKSDKKSKDTIVITKKNLYLFIFLAAIAIIVAIAVPATIHLKQQRNGGNPGGGDSPAKPIKTSVQVGEDGYFFAHFVEKNPKINYPVDDGLLNATPEQSTTNCAIVPGERDDSETTDGDEKPITNCITLPTVYGTEDDLQNVIISSPDEFEELLGFRNARFNDEFFKEKDVLVVITHMEYCSGYIDNVALMHDLQEDSYTTQIDIVTSCGDCADDASVYFIELGPDDEYDYIEGPEYNIVGGDEVCAEGPYYVEKKPVIYLYPTSTTDVDVKLGAPEKLTVSYPKYSDAWKVTASPDGTLVDRKTGRQLYSLYYETDYTSTKGIREEGFVVKGADSAKFLEEKLAKLGLNEREAEEFIIYWLPILEQNAYNYIYFAPAAEIAENMPLNVSPAPETVIRINMEFKALNAPIQVKEQQLPETPVRKGFTLVEWGGTIL